MAFAGISGVAILAAAIAGFVFGGAWYGVLGRHWMAAMGKTEAEMKSGHTPISGVVIAFIAALVMAWVLAGLIGHMGPGAHTVRSGLISGAFVWLGFVATTVTVNHAFQKASRALTLIDLGHWLGVLLIQGAIIGWLGVAAPG